MPSDGVIPVAHPVLDGNEAKYVSECLESSWISSAGKYIGLFESAFAEFCGVRHAVATNNGTTALHLALAALGVGPGDEVVVPTLTYVATANAVTYCGARVVLVDVDLDTMGMAAELVADKITPRTRAIIPVHLYGHPADMGPLLRLAKECNVPVVEDAAEAHGASYDGRPVGSMGRCGVFSFFGNKIVTTGEGGMVTTDSDALVDRLRLLRGQGMDPRRRYWFPVVGYNYRMTNVAAALGLAQLERVQDHLNARRNVAQWYRDRLEPYPDLIRLPKTIWPADPVPWLYTIVILPEKPSRDEIMQGLAADRIETRPVFYPMHTLPPYFESEERFPIAQYLSERGLSLPTHGKLTEDDVDYICARLILRLKSPAVS